MSKILVIGATGFVGRHLVQALIQAGHSVRCLARNPDRLRDMVGLHCEVVKGDISDSESIRQALESIEAAYITIHTISAQQGTTSDQGFMDIEINGLRNIVEGCKATGTKRLIYLNALGTSPDSTSVWGRERWKAEQLLLQSGLDVTTIRPGQIVGKGGHGFNMMISQASRRVAVIMAEGRQMWRNIALDDLLYYLVGVLDDPRSYGQCYEVGTDDVLTYKQMVDVTADILGRPHPWKVQIPNRLMLMLAPIVERQSGLPKGALRGLFDGAQADMVGNPAPIRDILPKPPMSYRRAVETALASDTSQASK